jgi:hypothetical protein
VYCLSIKFLIHEINNNSKKSVHFNSVHVEETILEKLFTFSNKSKDKLSKITNVEHPAQPKYPTYHTSQAAHQHVGDMGPSCQSVV